ncbi:trk system potassium uptake protein TrkH [Marinobacter persicus]|uniref:Trk system potassium uptake protein n=1 Tax=Marinobacter persicus TaxID=930118 RepID=A0A1I3QJI1_9GAMM|nr:TrkH family potassium uptake protein [Marinobacter persicus]GHD42534.1 Trk system potassium uptake protein [Marinobacter persicus]SFJ34254.1 trk system potassium uptake protein TrkH [Marinobacter persicus]
MALFNLRPVIQILGFLLILLSFLMTLPVNLLMLGETPDWLAFVKSASICFVVGLTLFLSVGRKRHPLKQREMFILTVSSWVVLPLFSSLPLLLSDLNLSITDAFFESISGVTTTGSTVMSGLDHLPGDILLWRSIMQWMGGIGIIGMAVAILPFLRIGGMRLFATESSEWTEKAVPRTNRLARGLVFSYFTLTFGCILTYWLLGMDLFKAVNHAFTTVSTGGYSTSDSSMGQFEQLPILFASTLFMMLGGIPFFLFVRLLNGQTGPLFRDKQVRFFLKFLVIVAATIAAYRIMKEEAPAVDAFVHALFNVTSVVTTTGYASQDYSLWGPFVVVLFFFLTFVGGCSGSTSGGMKIFRFQLSMLLLREQVIRLLHPNAVIARHYNGRIINDEIVASSVAFSFIFLATLAVVAAILAFLGLDLVTSLTGAATALANVGPGLGDTIGPAGNFQTLPDAAKWVLMGAMLLGRLELLSVFVLFSPHFWRG